VLQREIEKQDNMFKVSLFKIIIYIIHINQFVKIDKNNQINI